ncbi:cubilin-like [Pomacea canaliculata]|uniref:cubilin-like n=1 Tax=Pomacea canaliculata TaxID=400727 RepID=UPI000D7323BC|nr:cubilin-like [Pomacea canaliculata]
MERRKLCLIAWTIAAGIVTGALSGCDSQCVANSRPAHLIANQNKTLSFTVQSLANTVRCEWLISSNTVNTRLRLTAIFNLRSHDWSCVDNFTVYDGNASSSPILLSTCSRPDFPIYSSGSDVLVSFTTGSPYSGERSNLTVIYEVFRPSVADATITDSVNVTTTTLYFLKYPEGSTLYPNNANRSWVFHTNDSQYVVHITFTNIDVEPSSGGCDYDYIEIFDSSMEANRLDRLCGHLTRRQYYSTGQSLYITFHSDDSVTRTGFNLTYTAARRSFIYPATTCLYDIVLTGADQSQRYLQYPGNSRTYSNNLDCYWLLHTSSYDYVVHVTFTFVSTESNTDCSYDFVEVFDGTYSQKRKVFKLCGQLGEQREFYSSGQYLLIHFHSDVFGTGQGFRLTYTSARRSASPQDSYGACLQGGHLPVNYSTQYLIYPPSPMLYNINVNCNWLLQTSYYDDVVHVTFTFVDMEADADCSYDYVQLFDGSSLFAPSLGKVCQFTSRDFYSSGSSMYIKFVSDSSTTGGGFEITYQAVSRYSLPTTTVTPTTCSLYPTSQTATSYTEKYVQYPTTSSNYTNNADCGWLITAANYDYVVHVTFTFVDTEYDSDCDNDYIEVLDGSSSYSASLGKLCGTESRDFYSTGQSVYIKFTVMQYNRKWLQTSPTQLG